MGNVLSSKVATYIVLEKSTLFSYDIFLSARNRFCDSGLGAPGLVNLYSLEDYGDTDSLAIIDVVAVSLVGACRGRASEDLTSEQTRIDFEAKGCAVTDLVSADTGAATVSGSCE